MSVQLTRGQQGYGFSLRGGQDLGMPLFILRMADGGTAYRDGRLKVRGCVRMLHLSGVRARGRAWERRWESVREWARECEMRGGDGYWVCGRAECVREGLNV